MKGKIFKKLKTIGPVDYLKPDHRVLQIKALNGYVESFTNTSNFSLKNLILPRENHQPWNVQVQESEKTRDLDDDKENIGPLCLISKEQDTTMSTSLKPMMSNNNESFRRPDMNSNSLFDPRLLAAFEQAVKEHEELRKSAENFECIEELFQENQEDQEVKFEYIEEVLEENQVEQEVKFENIEEMIEEEDVLEVFEEKCPPGGNNYVILYTTTLRGIRKTFEDCNKIRFLLDSFKVVYIERDTSMHMKFKEELWKILEGKPLPPRLFVKGRYIGGVEEVLNLNEQGKLRPLFAEMPVRNSDALCEGCDGVRFIICLRCNGSHKIITEEDGEDKHSSLCLDCNENGLIVCPSCST